MNAINVGQLLRVLTMAETIAMGLPDRESVQKVEILWPSGDEAAEMFLSALALINSGVRCYSKGTEQTLDQAYQDWRMAIIEHGLEGTTPW